MILLFGLYDRSTKTLVKKNKNASFNKIKNEKDLNWFTVPIGTKYKKCKT